MYELLLAEYDHELDINELDIKKKGYYSDNVIAISKYLETNTERACILVEEIGHHETSYGDILNPKCLKSIKQEKIARNWGYRKLIQLEDLIKAYKYGCSNRYETAEYLDVTEEFLESTIQHYKERYGILKAVGNYIIYFEPDFGVMEIY